MNLRANILSVLMTHLDSLVKADISIARMLGAPSGFTISGNAYRLALSGSKFGIIDVAMIDWFFKFIIGQEDHCWKAYRLDVARSQTSLF